MDLLDRDPINLTAGAGFVGCSKPSWSPDGSAIAFAAATGGMDGDYELYTVAVPTDPQTPPTPPQRLTQITGRASNTPAFNQPCVYG